MRETVQHAALTTTRAVRPSVGFGGQRRGGGIGKRAPARRLAAFVGVLCLHELVELCLLANRGDAGISNPRFLGADVREYAY